MSPIRDLIKKQFKVLHFVVRVFIRFSTETYFIKSYVVFPSLLNTIQMSVPIN